ncbi:MAG TPA: helix-turn-helix domain-containing protein [Roseiflexaceae bacterium]|nr:helix-turn-helix domain-containing protein [Roseiflexaceae bacterium]
MNESHLSRQDEPQALSLRERKKRLAQAAIEEAALRLFQQQGYEHTSIQDIADAVTMSSRTIFRYFASKEEVLVEPVRAILGDALRFLQRIAPSESPQAALRATLVHLAGLYQQQRTSFLIRYRVAKQARSIAAIYLYAMMETEPALCDALYAHLEAATDRDQIRFLVAVHMAAMRVAIEEWVEGEAQGELVALLGGMLEALSALTREAP